MEFVRHTSVLEHSTNSFKPNCEEKYDKNPQRINHSLHSPRCCGCGCGCCCCGCRCCCWQMQYQVQSCSHCTAWPVFVSSPFLHRCLFGLTLGFCDPNTVARLFGCPSGCSPDSAPPSGAAHVRSRVFPHPTVVLIHFSCRLLPVF